jgi:hypothetical protein
MTIAIKPDRTFNRLERVTQRPGSRIRKGDLNLQRRHCELRSFLWRIIADFLATRAHESHRAHYSDETCHET